MAPVLNPWRKWQMLRHSRGFGIHSPFAYRFITEVIRQPYAYYAYDELPDHSSRLLFRVLVALGPRRIAVYGPRLWSTAAKAAWPHANVTVHRPDFVAADFSVISQQEKNTIINNIEEGASFYGVRLGNSDIDSIKAAMKQGMTFSNGRGAFIAVAQKLPRQDFELNF